MEKPARHAPTNRIAAVMEHTTRYAFKGKVRLARDAGVSKSAVGRLLSGGSSPSAALLLAVTAALERAAKRPLDPRELVSFDGRYPTSSVCVLMGCSGCLPGAAYGRDDRLKPEYRRAVPGEWSGAVRKEAA